MEQKRNRKQKGFSRLCYRVIRWLVGFFYPKVTVEGVQHLPDGPCLVVGNHCKMNGPIIGELYFPGERAIWCAGEMMELKEVPAYAYQDFWSYKPKHIRWFYKLASYVIAPLCVCVFNNARTIGVYHDNRVISTFRRTVEALTEGKRVVVFPECYEAHNHIVNNFQTGFVDVARLYYKRTGEKLQFVPMYMAPLLKKVYLGEPVTFRPDAPKEEERRRVCGCLMDAITKLAVSMPRHRVVPYPNLSKKDYPSNIPDEVTKT